jgi:multiple antibiotic resistance protein
MRDIATFTALTFSAIFFVVDPFAVIPIFLAMTEGDSDAKRKDMARRACLVAGGVMAVFAMFGGVIFRVFGISLPAFKVAGGILLLITAIDMLRAQPSRTRSSPVEEEESAQKEDIAIVPLAMPLLAGPGAIATSVVVMGRAKHLWYSAIVVACIAATSLISYVMLRAGPRINRVLGQTGVGVLGRIMGLMLAAIGVQFLFDGGGDWLRSALKVASP